MSISIWTGNYGSGDQETLVRFSLDSRKKLRILQTFTGLTNPSFLIWHPTCPVLYTVEETQEGAVCAWSVKDGNLCLLARLLTGGSDPCHLALSPDMR